MSDLSTALGMSETLKNLNSHWKSAKGPQSHVCSELSTPLATDSLDPPPALGERQNVNHHLADGKLRPWEGK